MGTVRREQHIECPPATTWDFIGDPARLHEWFPLTDCRVEGKKRWVTTSTGLTFEEDIVLLDHELRRFQYTIVNNPLVTGHLGTLDVIDDGHGHTLAVYSTTMKPDVLALVIGGAAGVGLKKAKTILEGTV